MKREKILVVEDEGDILEVVQYNLAREGFKVVSVRDGEQGLARVRRDAPDLVILDLMLPGMDGVEICRRIKQDPITAGIPVIMLTAKGDESDVLLGLGMGADDYMTKPFSPKELIARVRTVLRRGPLREERVLGERLVRGGITIDVGRHEVLLHGEPVVFTPTELRLLHFLASHPGRVFDRSHLLSRVIGEDAIVTDRNIDVHVRSVRSKLGDQRDVIETVRGVGYRFRDGSSAPAR